MKTLDSRNINLSLWAIFLIWPILALISSIKNYRANWAKNGLLLFIVFYGFTFFAQEGNDSSRYILFFNELHNSETDFKAFSNMFYSVGVGGQRSVDIYGPTVAFIVSRFTNDPRILYSVIALIFGFFYTRNIWLIIDEAEQNHSYLLKFLLIVFAFIIPIWSINGIRFWTASQVLFFGASRFFLEGRRSGLFMSVLTIFIHFSFLFPVLLLLLYLIIGNRPKIYFALFIFGMLFSEINIPFLSQAMINFTPGVFHERISTYSDVEQVAGRMVEVSSVNWYAVWYNKALHLFVDLMLIIVFFKGKEIWYNRKELLCFFSFLLLFRAVTCIMLQIPIFERFLKLNDFFSLGFLILYFYYNTTEKLSKNLIVYLIPLLGFFLVITIREGFDNTGLLSIISNPLIAPFLTNDYALIDLIK